MNKSIQQAFKNKKAFIPFITCGDPDLETTEKIVLEMANAGADLIELGIPFSDPTAEGPVIQAASKRALDHGVLVDEILEMAARLNQKIDLPMVFMTYANVIYSYGTERFMKEAAKAGMSGLILPDVPYEEKEEFSLPAQKYGLELISLIAPTSHERIRKIAKDARGFLYCVSSMGVTGTRSEITTDIDSMIALVREVSDIPVAVGFGISTPQQAALMASKSDGAIVGSAIVSLCEKHGHQAIKPVGEFVREMKGAILQAG